MTVLTTAATGPELAIPLSSSPMSEASRGLEMGGFAHAAERDEERLKTPSHPTRLLDAWKPSERRRLGYLSTRSYEQPTMSIPTDLWSYQRLFIEQRRDAANPFIAKPLTR